MANERLLRALTLVSAAVALPLMILTTIVSIRQEQNRYHYYWQTRHVTTFCFGYIPLIVTAGASNASLFHYRKHGTAPGPRIAFLDAGAIMTYIAILLPIWIVEIGRLNQPGWALLATYLTVPMLFNLFTHCYLLACNSKAVWAFLAPETMHECPSCHNQFLVGGSQAEETRTAPGGYSLLRGEVYLDDDAVPSADVRDSTDHIRPEAETKGDGKGKAMNV